MHFYLIHLNKKWNTLQAFSNNNVYKPVFQIIKKHFLKRIYKINVQLTIWQILSWQLENQMSQLFNDTWESEIFLADKKSV